MIYRREHPSNPSKRFRSYIINPLGTKIANKVFYKVHQTSVGQHFGSKVCARRKKSAFKTKFNIQYGVYTNAVGLVTQISLERRYKTFTGLVAYSNGALVCMPLFSGASLNFEIKTFTYLNNPKIYSFTSMRVGSSLPIAYLPVTACFFNILQNLNNASWFCRAAGTFCTLIRYNIEKGTCLIKLPTSALLAISESSYVTLGRNSNILPRGIWIGKAGINIQRGYRPSVRGVAKNPVDHPHGGRTKSNSPERTPWGKVAKFNK